MGYDEQFELGENIAVVMFILQEITTGVGFFIGLCAWSMAIRRSKNVSRES